MVGILIIVGLIINIVFSHIVALTAKDKQVGYNTTMAVSIILSPLIGLLLSIASPIQKEAAVIVEVKDNEDESAEGNNDITYNALVAVGVVVAALLLMLVA